VIFRLIDFLIELVFRAKSPLRSRKETIGENSTNKTKDRFSIAANLIWVERSLIYSYAAAPFSLGGENPADQIHVHVRQMEGIFEDCINGGLQWIVFSGKTIPKKQQNVLQTHQPLAIDMRVMVTYYPPRFVLVKLDRTKMAQLPGLEAGIAPITPLQQQVEISKGQMINRRQLPITGAYAFTNYR
jgi:hypothetical protein